MICPDCMTAADLMTRVRQFAAARGLETAEVATWSVDPQRVLDAELVDLFPDGSGPENAAEVLAANIHGLCNGCDCQHLMKIDGIAPGVMLIR